MDDIVTELRTCHCHDGYKSRNLIDPSCEAHNGLKADAADEIERLRAELDSQTQWAELMAGNHCYCIPDDVGVCLPCAYRRQSPKNGRRPAVDDDIVNGWSTADTKCLRRVGYAHRNTEADMHDLLCRAADEIERLREQVRSLSLQLDAAWSQL